MRLLVECTYVYDNPHINSGIQRVVRNIISKLHAAQKVANAIPVILKNNKIYEVKRLFPDNNVTYIGNRLLSKLVRAKRRCWLNYERTGQFWPFSVNAPLRKGLFFLCKMMDVFFYFPISIISHLCQKSEIGKRIVEISAKPGDVLILLDASWHSDLLAQIEKLKAQGVAIVSVIYDLIPLTHPQFCDEVLTVIFQRWFQWVGQTADGLIAISQTIRDQAQAYVRRNIKATKPDQWFDYFHLGSELDLAKKNGVASDQAQKLFQNGRPVYLMVGTIEPRKNHGFLLDAFELLWREDLNVNLCFVGKVGWKCRDLIKRVEAHSELNRRLFMFNNLNDTDLEFCYQNARSLVFPAFVEGFGLPLVEAMQRGLPVMAGDIPVFREVGGDFIAYFDLENPQTLAALVRQYETDGVFPARNKLKEWRWLTWEDSANQFLTKIAFHVTETSARSK